MYLRVVEKKSDGIVIKGAKVHISYSPVEEWIMVLPTRRLTNEEGDWAIACAVPADAEGVKLVVSAACFETSGELGAPGPFGSADAMVIFDNV